MSGFQISVLYKQQRLPSRKLYKNRKTSFFFFFIVLVSQFPRYGLPEEIFICKNLLSFRIPSVIITPVNSSLFRLPLMEKTSQTDAYQQIKQILKLILQQSCLSRHFTKWRRDLLNNYEHISKCSYTSQSNGIFG